MQAPPTIPARTSQPNVAGGGTVPVPASPAGTGASLVAREILDEDTAVRLAEASWQRYAHDVAEVEDLLTTAHGLDVLDALPITSRARAGLRCKVYHLGDDGHARHLCREWATDLPTEDRLGRLVNAGVLPEGEYRVILWRGRQALPRIVIHVAAATQRQDTGRTGRDDVLALLSVLTGGRPLLPAPGSKDHRDDFEDVRSDVSDLQQEVRQLGDLLTQGIEHLKATEEKGGGELGALGQLLAPWLSRSQATEPAPEAMPARRVQDLTR